MLALKHLVFCLSVSAAYANVEFQSWKKPPDNNPDLNRKDLGAMQDAWETIKATANQSYYLIYSSGLGTREHYKNVKCLQVHSSGLNHTLKSANYTSKWYNTESKHMESSTQYVQAVKQKDYSIENIMHLGQPQRKATSPNGTCYNLYFNFICESNGCLIYHQECWQKLFTKYSEKYVLFENSPCFILRSLQDDDGYESCEFWLKEDWLKNVTIPQVVARVGSEESEENEKDSGNTSKTMYLYDSLFKQLPFSCRYAFLLNCGYPTYRIYDKESCDKIDKTDNAASGDANGSN
uniref:Putative salivary lipocalin n=1 Tax=Ixodes ricinus TaxID=34613 RepID=A0A0K8R6J7_IXORI